MRTTYLLPLAILLSYLPSTLHAQNYLRVSNPDNWGMPISIEPGWEEWRAHGQLDEITIVAQPQGVFTQIEFYATISQGPDAWSSSGDFEIVWQFELPGKSIVHDSWLWIGPDIIKADMVDYWTALATYEEIVDRNQDPSFFYRLPDNRYEIRIYPMLEGEQRRIKMSFLIPAEWNVEQVKSNLLQNLLQSTDYPPPVVAFGMPVSDLWQAPQVLIDNNLIPVTDTVVNGTGTLMHYLEWPGNEVVQASDVSLMVDAPLSDNNTFVHTFSEGSDNFYQLVYLPDWEDVNTPPARNSLILLDYNAYKTSLSKEILLDDLLTILDDHFTEMDAINVAVMTSNGVQFLSDTWWDFDPAVLADTLTGLLEIQDEVNLEQLLSGGFSWAQNQTDIDHVYVLAANDDYVYPPAADAVFGNIESLIPTSIPITFLDYQDENVSIIFYGNEEYEGNEYFYQLFATVNTNWTWEIYRNSGEQFDFWLQLEFPSLEYPAGIMDYTTSLENGITFQRYNINDFELTEQNRGAILQTGKYLGGFPLHINANLITDDGQFYSISNTVESQDIQLGDTLMREMWYGSHLKELELLAGSDDDRNFIIEQSIVERVLTGLTAFLALEPNQGGEPCIDCLLNSGEIIVTTVDEFFDLALATLISTPNPATDLATIQLIYTAPLNSSEWTAKIYDLSGRLIKQLDVPVAEKNELKWEWRVGTDIGSGVYFCKVRSKHGELTTKIIVITK